jgi:uncharacterized membrane protein YbhN (UPF0104 family)
MAASAGAAAVGTLVAAPAAVVAGAWALAVVAAFVPSIAYRLNLRPGRLLGRLATVRGGAAGPGSAGRFGRLVAGLGDVDEALAGLLVHPGRSLHFVLTTAGIFAIFAAQLWLVLIALGTDIGLAGAWAVLGLATIAGVLSALPFGLGAADLVIVVLLGTLGVEATAAGAGALLLRAVATLPLGILGTASWVVLSRGPDALPLAPSEIAASDVLSDVGADAEPTHR